MCCMLARPLFRISFDTINTAARASTPSPVLTQDGAKEAIMLMEIGFSFSFAHIYRGYMTS